MTYEDKPSIEELYDELYHYGMPRRSGRYPYGSGDDPYQHGRDFIGRIEEYPKNFTYTDADGKVWTGENAIAKDMGLTTTQYRLEKSYAKDQRRMYQVARVESLMKDGLGPTEIGRVMGLPESTVRSLQDSRSKERMNAARETANFLKSQVDKKGMVDVGTGVEKELGISAEKLNQALFILNKEGYPTYSGGIEQVTNRGQQTTQKVLCPPGTKHKEIFNLENVHSLNEYATHDGGKTFDKFVYPKSMDSKRLKVLLADEVGPDGEKGVDKDGIIQIRRGVEDLSLGNDHYSQVRILVDDKKYLKGMAVYSDNMPDGIDVIFNSNKTSYDKALKDIKDDPENPFGSLIGPKGQSYYIDKDGNKQLSLINKRAQEGDWSDWKDTLPSQFLSKQSRSMAKKQLDLAKADKLAEYEDICKLENPTIKKHLLQKFADECDSAAVDLKAAALPGQKYHVIIPVNTLKDDEIYAPNYENGTKLALIRYPHGGTFEIPILTVNNKNKTGKNVIGNNSIDAVGINKINAERLSGADFDGDTVMCIPTHDPAGKVKIKSTPALEGLKGFDPQSAYPERPGMKYMKDPVTKTDNTQKEMGVISNLITDMTLAGAKEHELAAAVRHSMVVIDAAKHKLDYKQSEIDNNIAALKKKYQVKVREDGSIHYGGAATLISRSSGEATIQRRQGTPKVNMKGSKDYDPTKPEGSLLYKTTDDLYYPVRDYDKATKTVTLRTTTGKKITYSMDDKEAVAKYEPVKDVINPKTGKATYGSRITNKDGTIEYKVDYKKQKSTNMAETDDANTLVSALRHPMEITYADHANYMKNLANTARKEMMMTGKIKYDSNAKKEYQKEVDSLMEKLNDASMNAPREREAQRKANIEVNAKKAADPSMKTADIKKASQQAISKYRSEVGSISRRDRNIEITDKEWEAIQKGAISESKLKSILNNTDIDVLRDKAMPKSRTEPSKAKISQIKAMSSSNYTLAEIAKKTGLSTTTISKYLKGAN